MALYFLSDVHLRLDHPERSRRLRAFADRLGDGDRLIIVGDLADFWYASRQKHQPNSMCEGLQSLIRFLKRGGNLSLIPGNHDASLDAFYRETLGVGFLPLAQDLVENGTRIHVTHGHTIGARAFWKAWMESHAFLQAFRMLPRPVASSLDRLLNTANEIERDKINLKHLARFRHHADTLLARADLVIFGHVHQVHDDSASPRMIVLGGWHQRSSFLRVDENGIELIVQDDLEHTSEK